MRILLFLLISGGLSAQDTFDYLLLGRSQDYVIMQYAGIGHDVITHYTNDGITTILFNSPRDGFTGISYGFVHDSCINVCFFFNSKWKKQTRKYMDAHFYPTERGWANNDCLIYLEKLNRKTYYLIYVKRGDIHSN